MVQLYVNMNRKITKPVLIITCLALLGYSFFNISNNFEELYHRFFPCKKPVLYTMQSYDDRFGISKEEFIKAIKEAEDIWEKPLNLNLFEFVENTEKKDLVTVNLTYDSRQEATDRIEELGIKVDNSKHSYDELKIKYESMQSDFLANKKDFEQKSLDFSERQERYTEEVEEWNKKGGAPENVYTQLNEEMIAINEEFEKLKSLENQLNKEIENINALVTVINRIAQNLNLNTSTLNEINKERGEEFTQGEYRVGAGERTINIYEFSTKDKLVNVLAHEFGHALGIEHIEDKEAIMYRLNENKTGELSLGDIQALKDVCKID